MRTDLRQLDPCFIDAAAKDKPTMNDWYRCCEKTGIPYIVVNPRRKYATLEWDCISLHPSEDQLITSQGRVILDELLTVFDRYRNRKSRFMCWPFVGFFYNLEINAAKAAAVDVYATLIKYLVDDSGVKLPRPSRTQAASSPPQPDSCQPAIELVNGLVVPATDLIAGGDSGLCQHS